MNSISEEVRMTLLEYIQTTKITIKKFSDQLGYTRTHISRVIHNKTGLSNKLKNQIYIITNGQVNL